MAPDEMPPLPNTKKLGNPASLPNRYYTILYTILYTTCILSIHEFLFQLIDDALASDQITRVYRRGPLLLIVFDTIQGEGIILIQ